MYTKYVCICVCIYITNKGCIVYSIISLITKSLHLVWLPCFVDVIVELAGGVEDLVINTGAARLFAPGWETPLVPVSQPGAPIRD